ncbi:MAG: ABC transporter permease [Candidatus Saccharimonadales bacterium]
MILIVIMFVMANMMLATIAIKSAVNESIKYAKESLGGTIYLQADMAALREQAMSGMDTSGSDSSGTRQRVQIERPSISIDMAQEIASSEYVKDYTYSVSASANASSYELVETEDSSMREQIREGMGGGGGFPGMSSEDGGSFEFSMGDTSIVGINSFAFISDVESGNMKLADGEIFDESTENGVMISVDLADENDLSVGDEMAFVLMDDETEITLTIVGTFDNSTDNYDPNTMYTNVETAVEFNTSGEDLGVQSVKYYLVNAEDKDAFLAEALSKYPTLEEDGFTLDIDTSAYDQMVGPIESVGGFATTILWVVIIASVVIITLIVTINVKDRRYEMGVLMSLGATKRNILGQVLIELVIVATVGFIVSVPTGTVVAKVMGNGLLDSQLTMNEEQTTQNFGRGQNAGNPSMGSGSGGGMMGGGNMPGAESTTSDVEAIDEIDVSATVADYAILFAAGYAIIILALIIPSVNVLRYEPKTILSGKE